MNGVTMPTKKMVDMRDRPPRRNAEVKSARTRSMSLVSLVKRLMILPLGVVWKNDMGALCVLGRGGCGEGHCADVGRLFVFTCIINNNT